MQSPDILNLRLWSKKLVFAGQYNSKIIHFIHKKQVETLFLVFIKPPQDLTSVACLTKVTSPSLLNSVCFLKQRTKAGRDGAPYNPSCQYAEAGGS